MPVATPEGDAELVRRCLKGDWAAFAARFAPLAAWVVRRTAEARGMRLKADEAEDIQQDVFVALFEDDCHRLRQFDPGKGLSAASWVGLVARQAALKHLSRRKGEGTPLPETAAPAQEGAEASESLARLRGALERLPPREALCLRLLMERGLPASEAAAVLKVSRQRVYELKDRAVQRLREMLGP